MLKVIIIVLLIAVVISLFTGLVFLFRDTDRNDSKRTLYALGTRIALATALLATISYGLFTGELRMGTNAPWHAKRHAPAAAEIPPATSEVVEPTEELPR